MTAPSRTRTASKTVEIQAATADVFRYIDDMRNVGSHMTGQSSMAMVGSKLRIDILSDRPTGVGATYRYSGRMLGMTIDFSESVTAYRPPHEKVWQTIGEPKLWIMASYEMRLLVESLRASASRLTISIAYELPRTPFWRIVGTLLAGPYSRWCLSQMSGDAKRALETATPAAAGRSMTV